MIKAIFLLFLPLLLFGFDQEMNIIYDQLFVEVFVSSILIIACIISSILYLMIKELIFLFYSFYTFSLMTLLASNNQLFFYLFHYQPNEFIIVSTITIALISGLWFVLSFVKFVENRDKLKKYFILFSVFIFMSIYLNYFLHFYITTILHFFAILATLLLIIFILVLSTYKQPLAKLLLIGWGFVFLGIAYNILLLFEIIDDSQNNSYNYVGGSVVLEVLIFAIALGLQLKYKNDERIEAIQTIYEQKRFATIGKILAGIEHQWRAPLNYLSSIIVNIQSNLFLQKKINKQTLQNSVDQIQEVLEHMDETMRDFRYFYTQEEKNTFVVSKIFMDTFAYFKRYSTTKNIELKIETDAQLQIKSYSGHFRHIFLNFLENSSKIATKRGLENLLITVNLSKLDNTLVCKIEDNAKGAKNIENIFEPFYSEDLQNGSGLGLYLVKELVEGDFKGEIEANNTNDGFQIILKVPYEKI